MGDAVLELRDVSKAFRRHALHREAQPVVAVDHVDLSVADGEVVGLVGESGAGKSTVAQLVLGLQRPDAGQVLFEGVDLGGQPERSLRRLRRRMHLILQDPYQSLHPGMRVGRVVAEPLAIGGVAAAHRAELVTAALEDVGLGPADRFVNRFPHELSGGQRQRVAMARALVARPRLAVADEPTSMLDASLRTGILELILSMRERLRTAFVFITHDLAVARYVSDRIAVMRTGQLIEVGETEELIARPREDYTRSLLAASEGVL